ncbi:response regulator [Roseibacillus persicicus]|uniref:response regulator n=1 Tax=Roseibacillus persicicus TaxID=454148 RepID=UPI00280F2FAA|nr:response regulator [Roseibacillus persicicus]MDQ8189121.1 response regulator [Roseibacillus persicicus]
MSEKLHPLLALQLKKTLPPGSGLMSDIDAAKSFPSELLPDLLAKVNESYYSAELQNKRLAHALQLSTNEANDAVKDLRVIDKEREVSLAFIHRQLNEFAERYPGVITRCGDEDDALPSRHLTERFQQLVDAWQSLVTQLEKSKMLSEELRGQADKASEAKSNFLAVMSHEIRTPLNGVIGMADLILQTSLTTEQKEHAETIHSCGKTLLSLIDDILDYAKIESGNLELEKKPFLIREAVEDSLELFKYAVLKKDIELLFNPTDEVPNAVLADLTRFRQIIANLVGNAVKFTSTGEIVVSVKRNQDDSHQGQWLFTVRDTGVGIPADSIPHLFQVFSQADSSVSRKFGGTGLGLAITRRLVHAMGGEIWVESVAGQGTSFFFTIDLPASEAEIQPERPSPVLSSLTGKRVLVVDDNATNLSILRNTLSAWHAEVTCFDDPSAALGWLRSNQVPDLIISDQLMPKMTGMELVEEVRRTQSGLIPILILTSVLPPKHSHKRLMVATKPIKASELSQIIAGLLEEKREHSPQQATVQRFVNFPASVLVAEDNPINQRLVDLILKSMGIRAAFVEDGTAAVDYVKEHRPDIILMDVRMPQMDGYEATEAIRQLTTIGEQPAIMGLTANALSDERKKAFQVGMDDYLTKPVKASILSEALHKACSAKYGPPQMETVVRN